MSNHYFVSSLSILGFIRSIFSGFRNPEDPSGQRVKYLSNGRSGQVLYEGRGASFTMYYEFGGGNVVASISIPDAQHWENETGLSPAYREEVLNFIGKQVVKDQTKQGSFQIEGNWLVIYE